MGGGHHHGGGHHGGGGRIPYNYNWGQGPWYDGGTNIVVVDPGDADTKARAMAYIMSLPKRQRTAAYVKIFGSVPPAGALSDFASAFGSMGLMGYIGIGAIAYLLYKWLQGKK
jgi:hypothetical protein